MSSAWEISVIVSLKYSKVNWSHYQYINRCIDAGLLMRPQKDEAKAEAEAEASV